MKYSTGLRNHLLATGSLRSAINGGVINVYSGSAPATADALVPAESTLLCTISGDGTGAGLSFEAAAVNGLLQKSSSQVWKGTVLESGLATWFRFVTTSDTGAASTSELRIQGTIDVAAADMQISEPNLTADADQKVDYFSVYQPE